MWVWSSFKRTLVLVWKIIIAPYMAWRWCIQYNRSMWISLPTLIMSVMVLLAAIVIPISLHERRALARREAACSAAGGVLITDKCILNIKEAKLPE